MYKSLLLFTLFISTALIAPSASAQNNAEIHVNSDMNFDQEIASLMNDLQLSSDQKFVIGLLILKYSLEFDYKEFQDASKAKQYNMAKGQIKELDKELKGILSKDQYKIYKKKKKVIKKKLMKSV